MFRSSLAPRLIVALLLCLLGVSQSGAAQPEPAAQTPLVRLSPTLLVVPIGDTSCMDLRVEDVENLFGFETIIRFDPSRLAVVDASPGTPGVQISVGPFLQPVNPGNWYVINSADNASGTIRLAITLFAPEAGQSGSGTLATICFRGLNRGHSAITLSQTETLLVDPQVLVIPFTAKSGGAFVGSVFRFHIPLVVRGH
ncbi:MAG: cohesin domain-containing protein [Anaerolineae bacterium]